MAVSLLRHALGGSEVSEVALGQLGVQGAAEVGEHRIAGRGTLFVHSVSGLDEELQEVVDFMVDDRFVKGSRKLVFDCLIIRWAFHLKGRGRR